MKNHFNFFTRLNLTELLGKKARNLGDFFELLKTVPGSSIYYHTHRFLQQHHFLSPEPPNDFAFWISNVLQEDTLGEMLASVDIVQFKKISELRARFVKIIEGFLKEGKATNFAPPGEEFHFMKAVTFVIPTGYSASNLEEFYEIMKHVTIHSIYYHMFEARLRLEKGDNDFSNWLENELGEHELALKISKLDPYTQTLDGLRRKIICLLGDKLNARNK